MDQNEKLHIEWIGMAQPEGLVVTSATLKAAEANITWPVTELQETLREQVSGKEPAIADLPRFFRDILGWSDDFVASGAELPASLRVTLEGSDPLAPQYAVRSADDETAFVLLVGEAGTVGGDLDAAGIDKRWTATPHQRFERLLRETGVHVGLLTNGRVLRLVYAPRGETAGWITFRLHEMLTVDGRPLLGALHMLLNQRRLLTLEADKRLSGLLQASREYQNTVSSALREQVLSALRALLVGFQNADRLAEGAILGDYRGHMGEIYKGLVTVLMRSVFVLFAEEQNLLPIDRALYADSYSLTRLYAQLVEDRDRYGDTIEDRYGAWARIVSLFRLLHDGVKAADGLYLPARRGDFFDPDAFPFLEGRPRGSQRQPGQILDLPRVSDGVVFRLLDLLLVLNGERLQYKGLDVEQVGSVYEGLMGFEVEVAEGDSLAVMPEHVVVNLEALLKLGGADRLKQLKELANLDLKDKAGAELKAATTVAGLQAALGRRTSPRQPGLLPKGSLYLQPGEERRKTGSHYTPKSLTSPIVETTLRPVLERLGPDFTPEQILDLCICDPAMGSGAFLVEACRQLADHLVAAWRRTKTVPVIPLDEDIVLHARRLVAQQCLYGVDKNPLAADLARLSLWLVTFAREHSFTFVDHALRCGDSLVGLSREQISNLSLDIKGGFKQLDLVRGIVAPAVAKAKDLRDQIHAIGDPPDDAQLVQLWDEANEALGTVRLLGDLVIAAYFSADSDKARKKAFDDLESKVPAWLATGEHESELKGLVADLREGDKGIAPFHWEVEFPEVFGRKNPGFDCFVGNPPFAGRNTLFTTSGETYVYYLVEGFPGAHGSSDLVAYFLRRCFALLSSGGACGLVATNTVAQGDTRTTGLRWICDHGGIIYSATRRLTWPGAAAVIVSLVHFSRGETSERPHLDGLPVSLITAFLFTQGGNSDPARLSINQLKAFVGAKVYGQGFVFDDTDPSASPYSEWERILREEPSAALRVAPYVGGEEVNSHPRHTHRRLVINLNNMAFEEAKKWPLLLELVEQKVRPERDRLGDNGDARRRKANWWHWGQSCQSMFDAIRKDARILVCSRHQHNWSVSFVSSNVVPSEALVVFALDNYQAFAVLQSRLHELWARFFGSSLKDDMRYTPSDCFETFPFPPQGIATRAVEAMGTNYFEFRAALMIKNNEGLTKTYNRFHNPEEHSSDILRLRELHAAMDRAVLDAYGWSDILPAYDFREQLDESVRLTWAEDTRDEVLARLLELNRVMAAREAEEAAASAEGGKPARKPAAKKKARKDETTLSLPLGKSEPEGT
jgi:hypothetical protein